MICKTLTAQSTGTLSHAISCLLDDKKVFCVPVTYKVGQFIDFTYRKKEYVGQIQKHVESVDEYFCHEETKEQVCLAKNNQ